ncbi:ABC-2 transporter permease [Actinoalloteichus hymeniacidonis]|uniref:DUF3533 family protein n=1 Tax=Actinoalloteichus hymeniacidonis TaxID=340345 RepID=A0AAC9HR74_9PSEU|nr:DUF3533 domain-containing protein [Actinoalloteichus hymeniacidonis]AOS64084.1 putative DUF3533 family protein [Actinoalloteichus hymeniacidonis]MBB5907853.1 hypothetical protein [Actinoalloteichus hymeniacidonis]
MRRILPGPHLPAFVISLIIAVFGALFVASYSIAMGDPHAHAVPIGVVGDASDKERLRGAIDAATGARFEAVDVDSRDAAVEAIGQQRLYGALLMGEDHAELLISSASGASMARIIGQDTTAIEASLGTRLTVLDLHPLSQKDPAGLVLFYMALASTIIGFVGAIQTRVNAGGLTLAGELGWDATRAVLAGLLISVTVGPALGLERFPVLWVWAVLAATMFIVGAVYSIFRILFGNSWGLLPTWVLFVLISNPSSGGVVAPELLPSFYEFMGRWLPTGATVRALRDLTYFPDAIHAEPYLVLGCWLLGAPILFVLLRRRRFGTGPSRAPNRERSTTNPESAGTPDTGNPDATEAR